ncbi:tyrosine-type recombinase/integrase [Clostridium pasteurianum]|uniref:Site-specific recombinase XerD n=1 Tax=Clostridium pasteurianum BC1 TaxID=86416 RepID=R4KF14_CLOPA|nr:tyrosine-type recombinase/integrase [Clostridium pasteurianum]AGK98200.1 site-specific recombinase XerD [Clostridium pasteurianum BC1]
MQYNITYRKKDNGWQYIISYKDNLGKWKQKSKQGFPLNKEGKQAAKDAALVTVDELKLKSCIVEHNECDKMSFKEFGEKFIKHETLYKTANTISSHYSSLKKFSSLYDLSLPEITNLDVQNCIDLLVNKKLKASTIKWHLSNIKLIFAYAKEKYKLIQENPASNIDIPVDENTSEKTALTITQLEDLLKKIQYKPFFLMSLLAAKCGLRIGEIVGLRWSDIDEPRSILQVSLQWKKIDSNKYGLGKLKTNNSKREVPIPVVVMDELMKFKKENPINFDNRIFKNKSLVGISSDLSRNYKKAGYSITVHELRHTYATMLISHGVDFKTAAKLLGHDIKQTMNTYSHVTSDMIENASKKINTIF